MRNLYHRLLRRIVHSTQKELASRICYLKIENEILRLKLPRRVPLTEKERKLVKFGWMLGKSAGRIANDRASRYPTPLKSRCRQSEKAEASQGRHRTPEEIHDLIVKLARENDWGDTHIPGELEKLRIKPPSRNTVRNI